MNQNPKDKRYSEHEHLNNCQQSLEYADCIP